MTSTARPRPVLGLLLNSLFDGFEESIWKSVVETAAEEDADLVCFLSGALAFDTPSNGIIDLLDARIIDGLIVVSGSVGWFTGPDQVANRIRDVASIPTVSVSERVAGSPSLLVDNTVGITRALEHLARDHGRRRMAFITGPPKNADALARTAAYREALCGLGLPFDPALVVEGDFGRHSGLVAVRELFDRGRPFDAILAANDAMALAALDELRHRGVAVPGDVAVVGFDDIVDAACHGLTTIRQPMRGMGRDAVRLLLARLRGEAVPAETLFPAAPVYRSTCGCTDVGAGAWRPAPALATRHTPASLADELAYQFPDMAARLGVARWASALASAALAVDGGEVGGGHPFLAALADLLERALPRVPEPRDWYRLVRAALEPLRHGDDAARAHAADLSDAAHELVATTAVNREVLRRARTEEEMRALRRLVEPVPLPDEVFKQNLLSGLPVLGMRSFFLARYVAPDRREAELVAHFDLDGAVELDPERRHFPAYQLVPGHFTSARRAYVVVPVYSPAELLGYALCEIGPMNASGYEMLLHEISTVLGVNRLMSELGERHRQLLETARQAGMADVAVGALHNVGNLLNSVSVSAEEIHDAALAAERSGFARAAALLVEHAQDLPGFFARDPRAALLPGYLGKAAEALTQELGRVRTEVGELLERTGLVRESIRALQDHARADREHLLRERFELCEIVHSALEIQRPYLERYGVEVRQLLGTVPPLLAPRSKLVHVLVNLLKNAVESMVGTPEGKRVITMGAAARSDGSIQIEVRDSGEGIAAENLPKLFTYGFTTKRDGHGFGLHTCANYMRQMGGKIEVHSTGPGQGATFTLTLVGAEDQALKS